jgi:hypothetical protein
VAGKIQQKWTRQSSSPYSLSFLCHHKHVICCINPYAKPSERKVGARRPKISHLPREVDTRTRKERQTEKQAVAAERRAIKKSARRHLKKQLLADLDNL